MPEMSVLPLETYLVYRVRFPSYSVPRDRQVCQALPVERLFVLRRNFRVGMLRFRLSERGSTRLSIRRGQ